MFFGFTKLIQDFIASFDGDFNFGGPLVNELVFEFGIVFLIEW